MKKTIIFFIIATVFLTIILLAQNSKLPITKRWEIVAELTEKQLPESALKEVEAILAQAQKENNSVEVIKALLYKMRFTLEINPDEAPALIQDFETFTEKSIAPDEQALLHSMTAELYTQYYQSQSYMINQRTDVKGIVPEDIKEWTKNIYFDKITGHLAASLAKRDELQKTDALKYASLLEKGEDSRTLQPTFFDFLAYRSIVILQQIGQTTSIKNPLADVRMFSDIEQFSILTQDTIYAGSIENKIIETYQQLLVFRSKTGNVPALLFADLQRLNYVKDHTEIGNSDSIYLVTLNRLEKQYSNNEAVVEVLAEKANYYLNHSEIEFNKKIAYEICTDGLDRFPSYKRIELLKNIQGTITQKNISISYNQVAKPSSNLQIKLNSSNSENLQLSVYLVNATAKEYFRFKQNQRNVKELYPKKSLIETCQIEITADNNFGNVETEIVINTGRYGIYEFCLETIGNEKAEERAIGTFTVTDLSIINRTNNSKLSSIYVLDRHSGRPQSGVKVSMFTSKWTGSGYEIEPTIKLTSNKNGLCQFPIITHYSNNIFFFEKDNDKFFSTNSNSFFNEQNNYENKDVNIGIFTDRSLYRPGQTLFFKGIVYSANKSKQETVARAEYEITLFDANNEKVSSKSLKTNDFGSFAGEFILPESGLNGAYRIQAGQFSQTIWVEEYKRPTFEVKIDKPKAEVRFGEKVTLTGNVKAYVGYNISNAKVKYRVIRRTHLYCWWWSEPDKEIINGTTMSKADGTFEVTFIPEKTKNEISTFRNDQFYSYTVYADVTDTKGETQQGEQTLSVGDKSLFIMAEISEKIDKKETLNIELSTETLNGEKLNSTVKYSLYRLEASTIFVEKLDSKTMLKEAEKVISGSFDTKNKKLNLNVNKLVSGSYKIVFTTADANGAEVKLERTFVLYSNDDKRPPVKSYVWFLTPKTECAVGENAQIIFGTSTKNSSVLYELMLGNLVLESRWISFSDEIKSFQIPFKDSYGAGVTAMFTFMKDEQLFTESVQIMRKVVEKKLLPTLSVFRDKLKPGGKAEWTVTIPESANGKNTAELLVAMYDASLDALRPHSWNFNPTFREAVLYSPQWAASGVITGGDYVSIVDTFYNIKEFQLDQLNWFGLSLVHRYYGGGRGHMRLSSAATMSKNSVVSDVIELKSQTELTISANSTTTSDVKKNDMEEIKNANIEKPIQIRTNFNETAFFYPQLRTDKQGNINLSFTAPESLTRWNVKMLAHTKDLFFGQNEAQVVTQKDLMVQINLPRFVRRSDKLVLIANIINTSNNVKTANVKLELIDPETGMSIKIKDSGVQTITLPANKTKAIKWDLADFSNYELVICKVVAKSATFSDGEQKYLPVLPDKILVTESLPLIIRGNETRTFNFESLYNNVSTVDSKSLTIEFSSNPTWYAVQALPTIAIPESDNAIDYFTAYYVNSLATYIANSNPKIAATFDRWKKAGGSREALISNLERNKELKNMLLEETPWVMAAKDETEQKKQIALLFDLNMQKNQAQQYLDKLISLQKPSGGFSWFKDMPESRYITQEIMLNLARLNKITGTVNYQPVNYLESAISSALNYLDLEIARDFQELKKHNKNYEKEMCVGSIQLFYLHLRSEYPTIPVHVSAQEALRFYTAQSEKYWTSFSLYGKAMMAVVANRNGKIQLANNVLKSLKENAMKTDEFGMYWAKNTSGYFWNERPIAVQSAIIEAFTEISSTQSDIEEMKIWLLKQKQTQRWDSPLSTVNAIYSLLHFGTDWLANTSTAKITVGNILLQPQSVEAGTGYFKQTIPKADIEPEMAKVTVSTTIDGITRSEAVNKSSIGWGAMYWQYTQDLDKISAQSSPLKISKKLFVEKIQASGKTMIPIEQTKIKKGDKVITRLVITTDRNMEFVALKDLRAACFEPVDQLSGTLWKENICYYKTIKDASTQFYFSYLPKGTYVFEYDLWANNSGEFTSGIASLQCQYAPEFTSHTGGERIKIW